MTYETVAFYSQTAALILFIALFAGVLVYVALPRNRTLFERAARLPLRGEHDHDWSEHGNG